MKRFPEFLLLPGADRWLLIKTALLVEAISLGIRLVPLRILWRLLTRVANSPVGPWHAAHHSADRVTWAVELASRNTLGAKSCLTQAMAAQVLLARRGYPALLHIGVARGEHGRFQAHAWVESKGKVVLGGPDIESFTPLAVLEVGGSNAFPEQNFD